MRQLYKVIEEHKATFDYAFLANPGEEISLGKEDTDMPGWFWCKNKAGLEAWIPETHINIHGETAVFNQPYNSIEHNIKTEEIVQYLGESLGWIECLDRKWKYGWIPSPKLVKI
jgi:hypothetical protein